MPVLESKLIIGASDETGAAFASVMAKIDALQARVATVQPSVTAVAGAAGAAVSGEKAAASADHTTGSFLEMAAAAAAAALGIKSLVSGIGQAFDQAHEAVRAQASGMKPEEVSADEKLSHELAAKYPAIPESAHMNVIRNVRSIVGSNEGAMELADDIAKLRLVAMGANSKASPDELNEEFDQLVKGIEIKGATQDPKEFKTYMQGIARGLNAFGDTLKPFEYYQMFKYGRQATPMLSDQFMLETAPELAQELKGSSYGRAVSAFNRAVVAGHDPHDTFRALSEWGLIKDENLDRTKTGEIKGLKPGAHIEGWETAQTNPNTWVREFLLPALAAHGITDKADVSAAIGRVFENQMAAQMVSILATQQQRIDKSRGILRGAGGTETSDIFARQDPLIAGAGLWNAISNAIASGVPAGLIAKIESGAATNLMRKGGEHTLMDLIADIKGHPTEYGPSFPAAPPISVARGRDVHSPTGYGVPGQMPYFPPSQPITIPQAQQSAPPASVTVNGQAQVDHTVKVEVSLSPGLEAKIDQIVNSQTFTVPLIGDGSGRMDSDAGPHRAGGIGAM